jgi:TRAP-type C4-dicarboxylate transport system permease small subunit
MTVPAREEAASRWSLLWLLQFPLYYIDRVIGVVIIVIMAVMVTIVSAQVFMRYVLNLSFDWADELSRLCFVWTIFLAIPLALKRGGHILMELVMDRVPSSTRDLLYRSMTALSMGMMVLITWEAWKVTVENWADAIPTLGWSAGLFFLAVTIGCAHTVLHLVNILFTGEPRRHGIIE